MLAISNFLTHCHLYVLFGL